MLILWSIIFSVYLYNCRTDICFISKIGSFPDHIAGEAGDDFIASAVAIGAAAVGESAAGGVLGFVRAPAGRVGAQGRGRGRQREIRL